MKPPDWIKAPRLTVGLLWPNDEAELAGRQEVGIESKSLQKRTYNTRDSLVITDPNTDLAWGFVTREEPHAVLAASHLYNLLYTLGGQFWMLYS